MKRHHVTEHSKGEAALSLAADRRPQVMDHQDLQELFNFSLLSNDSVHKALTESSNKGLRSVEMVGFAGCFFHDLIITELRGGKMIVCSVGL